jgi:hypothetical protein
MRPAHDRILAIVPQVPATLLDYVAMSINCGGTCDGALPAGAQGLERAAVGRQLPAHYRHGMHGRRCSTVQQGGEAGEGLREPRVEAKSNN